MGGGGGPPPNQNYEQKGGFPPPQKNIIMNRYTFYAFNHVVRILAILGAAAASAISPAHSWLRHHSAANHGNLFGASVFENEFELIRLSNLLGRTCMSCSQLG